MIYLIVGRTGSGKDYLARKLTERGLKQVLSYATRPKRSENENSHIFITPEEADQFTDKVAQTVINGYEYFATAEQVNESDIYIIDPNGIDVLVKNMPETEFQVVYVQANDDLNRKANAVKRAEDKIAEEQVFDQRNAAEDEQFSDFEDKIYNRMDDEVCFPSNINHVLIYTNDYTEESVSKYADGLIQRKTLIERMTAIVKDCLDMGILEKADDATDNGEPKVKSYITSNDGETRENIAATAEHCAIRLLGDPDNFMCIMQQYITASEKFS